MIYRQKKNPQLGNRSKRLFLSVFIVVLITVFMVTFMIKDSLFDKQVSTDNQTSSVEVSPPTEEDQKRVDEYKQDLDAQNKTEKTSQQQSVASPGSKYQVTPVIISLSQSNDIISVNGFINGIVEDGGTCTVTLSKDSEKITQDSVGFNNASTTNCSPINISTRELSRSGEWSAILSYDSKMSAGVSEIKSIIVQK